MCDLAAGIKANKFLYSFQVTSGPHRYFARGAVSHGVRGVIFFVNLCVPLKMNLERSHVLILCHSHNRAGTDNF